MKLRRRIVTFKSTVQWFEVERQGLKPNTVRLMSPQEYLTLAEYDPSHICIEMGGAQDFHRFTRRVRSIYCLAELLGQALVMVCWEHEEDQ